MKNPFIIIGLSLALISFCTGDLWAEEFEASSWPYEGIPYFRVLTDKLLLHTEPKSDSSLNDPVPIEKGSYVSSDYGVKQLLYYQSQGTPITNKENETINTEIMFDKSIQRTIKPGILVALKDGSFEAFNYGNVGTSLPDDAESQETDFSFKQGDLIEYLLYFGESNCLYRFKNNVFLQFPCLGKEIAEDHSLGKPSEPETEWWLRFQKNGVVLGWLKMDKENKNLELVDTIK
jgi:hypothetical protein